MALLISTNMYKAGELPEVFYYLDRFPGQLGVEVFPVFHEAGYWEMLNDCISRLKGVSVSFHGPYYQAEHSAAPGTPEYEHTMEMTACTLDCCRILNSRYMVYHHNNRPVREEEREAVIKQSCINFRTVEAMAKSLERIPGGAVVAVENAGVMDRGNMLFGEDAFIDLCKKEQYKVLLDIGHAHANGWNLERVIKELKTQIAAYHLHNNDGIHDSHRRIGDGTLDFGHFLEYSSFLTPKADMVLEYSMETAGDRDGICFDIERLLRELEK